MDLSYNHHKLYELGRYKDQYLTLDYQVPEKPNKRFPIQKRMNHNLSGNLLRKISPKDSSSYLKSVNSLVSLSSYQKKEQPYNTI